MTPHHDYSDLEAFADLDLVDELENEPGLRIAPEGSRFPCLDQLNRYCGCVGFRACSAVKCWSGHVIAAGGREWRLQEVKVDCYTASQCATCANVVEVSVQRQGCVRDKRLLYCQAGLWMGLCSVYSLANHRVPLKDRGRPPCPEYVALPKHALRPEVVAQRREDAARAHRRRDRAKATAA